MLRTVQGLMISRLAAFVLSLAGVAAPAHGQPFVSRVASLRVTATADLPRGPGATLDEYCTGKTIRPRGAAGRVVAGRGWLVTAEAALGRYQAVSFVGGLEPGTSGACYARDANVALFAAGRLVAIVHGAGRTATGPRQLAPTNHPDRLRLWPDEYSPPLADLMIADAAISVVPVAAADPWCGRQSAVPNVYGLTIQAGRTRLLRAGWRPVANAELATMPANLIGRERDLRRAGVTEVQSCSGTGFGLCQFSYRHPRGATLEVTTAGEQPQIVDYGVTCARRR